ncbi:MAG: chromosomal replication initiator protein DnaA [Erysipelotrichaceae bacterium]|nr:chromosomal replication initiator protein DnaA [Erysipelotrichaceae bacterium]
MSNRESTAFLQDTWTKALNYIDNSEKVEKVIFNSFFQSSTLYSLNDDKATILVPSIIHESVFSDHKDLIETALEEIMGSTKAIHVDIVQQQDVAKLEKVDDSLIMVEQEVYYEGQAISPDRTFDNFVVGDCNKESHAAALATAYNPGKYFNPLFIYGNSGCGKTHLLLSIGNYVLKNDPTKRVYYTDSLKFVENVVSAIQNGNIEGFKKYMYSVDILLIDDVQFLASKEKSHEIFFTIFNELVNNRKQIVIASDRMPSEIKGLEERLISRFNSGLSVGIDSPEFETSLAILKLKLKSSTYESVSIDDEGLAFLASNFNRDVRSLEGALNRVLFYAIEFQNDGNYISFETCCNALKGQAVVSDKTGLSPNKIIKAVADYYGLTKQQLTSKTRTKKVATARHIAIYLSRKILDLPYIKIGEEFGGRDHSTIMSACEKVEKQLKESEALNLAIKEIEKQLS